MSRSHHQATLGILGHAFDPHSTRAQIGSMLDPVRPSDRRRMQSANDSSLDDVPTPEEVDPSLRARATCDGVDCTCAEAGYLDNYEPRRVAM